MMLLTEMVRSPGTWILAGIFLLIVGFELAARRADFRRRIILQALDSSPGNGWMTWMEVAIKAGYLMRRTNFISWLTHLEEIGAVYSWQPPARAGGPIPRRMYKITPGGRLLLKALDKAA